METRDEEDDNELLKVVDKNDFEKIEIMKDKWPFLALRKRIRRLLA